MQGDESGLDCGCKLGGEEWLPVHLRFVLKNTASNKEILGTWLAFDFVLGQSVPLSRSL